MRLRSGGEERSRRGRRFRGRMTFGGSHESALAIYPAADRRSLRFHRYRALDMDLQGLAANIGGPFISIGISDQLTRMSEKRCFATSRAMAAISR